jgi:hypothetical protein
MLKVSNETLDALLDMAERDGSDVCAVARRILDDATRPPVMKLKERTPEARDAYLQGYAAGQRDERKACATLADDVAGKVPPNDARHIDWQIGYQDGAMEVAAAIRERNNS